MGMFGETIQRAAWRRLGNVKEYNLQIGVWKTPTYQGSTGELQLAGGLKALARR